MKKIFYIISIICISLVMQSCPGCWNQPNQPQNVNNQRWGVAYLLSTDDTVEVKYSDVKENPHTRVLYPLNYLQQVSWFPEQHDSIAHSTDRHELHVTKMTNKSELIVIESPRIYINDECWNMESFTDPSDTMMIVNVLGKVDTIIRHIRVAPYNLNDVINELELNYPEYVHRVSDTETHHFNNWKATMERSHSQFPRIQLSN